MSFNIFICYGREDPEASRRMYSTLREDGHSPLDLA